MPITGYSARDIAHRCQDVREVSDGYRAPCPAHGGDNPDALHIWEKGGQSYVKCFTHNCSVQDIIQALGLHAKKLTNSTGQETVYDYVDASGNLLFQVIRSYRPNGQKSFRQRRPDPASPDGWIWNLHGVERVLYRYPQVIQAVSNGNLILLVEGEECVRTAERLGFVATTKSGGAKSPFLESYREALRGAHIVLIADNDGPGRDCMAKAQKALEGCAASVCQVDLPSLEEHGDITDWAHAGGTREQLDAMIAAAKSATDAKPNTPWDHIEHLPDFLAHRVEMPEGLARDLLYPGGITLVAAPSGIGKSVVTHIVARELASGGLYRGQQLDKARVLLIDTDNARSLVQNRLSRVCNEHRIDLHIATREQTRPLSDREYWQALPAEDFDVVILDSFGGATPGISEKEGAQFQRALDVIKSIADRGPAVLVLDNTTKSAENYRGRGEKAERVDVVYECRDVTNWEPTASDWWLDLPDAGDSAWQERASRRRRMPKIRLAFIARKFRWGEEPDPFVLEVSFDTNPWSFEDVTETVQEQADNASQTKKTDHAAKQAFAVESLAIEIKRRHEANEPVLGKREAQDFLSDRSGLKRAEIRRLIASHDANVYPSDGRWRIDPIPESRGGKMGLFGLIPELGTNNTQSQSPSENNNLELPYLCHPHHSCTAQIPNSENQQNQSVESDSICAVHFNSAKSNQDSVSQSTNVTQEILGTNSVGDNSNEINGENDPHLCRPGNTGMAQISDFEPQENQLVVNQELFVPSSGTTQEELDDDMACMLAKFTYARPASRNTKSA